MKRHLVIGILAILTGAGGVRADRLIFDNGDRLTGIYIGNEGEEVIFDSPILGRIRAPSAKVSVEIEADEPESAVEDPPEEVTGPVAVRVEPPAAKPRFPRWNRFWEDNIFFDTLGEIYPLMAWDNQIEFGIDLDFGESDTRSTLLRFQTERELTRWNFLFEASYEFAETTDSTGEETRTTDRLRGRARIRRDVNEAKAFFIQSNTRYNRDIIGGIFHEVEETLGMGYRWLETTRWQSSVVASTGAGYREIGTEPARFGFVATLYQDMSYQLSESVIVSEETNFSYVPTTTDQSAYLFSAQAELQTRLNAQLSLNLRYEFLFDERVVNPAARTRQSINLSLGAEF